MSAIVPKPRDFFRRGMALRRELAGFIVVVTVWAFSLNVFASGFFALLQKLLSAWAGKHLGFAILTGTMCFLVLSYLGFLFLAWGLSRSMEETRQIVVLVPILAFTDRVETVPVEGYWFGDSLILQGDRNSRLKSYREAVQRNPGRPIQGVLYQELSGSVMNVILSVIIKECAYLLSEDAQFHGVNYFELGNPPGPCKRVPIRGNPDHQIHLPEGSRAELRWGAASSYGKSNQEIAITSEYGTITVRLWPEWPILGDYHQKSLELAKSKLRTQVKNYSDRNPSKPPTLFVLELPVNLEVRFRSLARPWIFLFHRFEVYASWVDELLERVEKGISWHRFVNKTLEMETFSRTVGEAANR
jgi:hypothetical protein